MSIQVSGLVHPFIRVSYYLPINILVSGGSVLAVCGVNGSGKTTFLKLLLNEVQPKKGIINAHAEYAYLGVKNGLKPQLKLRLQLPYFTSKQQQFPWPEFLDKIYQDLSKGQQRLVALWIVLHSTKSLILIDEPFMHLDKNNSSLVNAWMNQQLNLKKTIILTHHNPEDLKTIQSLQVLDLNEC